MSDNLRRHFIKDQRLPIQMVSDAEFTYAMNLYDSTHGCWAKYKDFMDTVRACGGESGYFSASSAFVHSMIDSITETESYMMLCATQNVTDYEAIHKPDTHSVYTQTYADKSLVSIDINSANFTALKSFDPTLVAGCETYEDFARRHTQYEYFVGNKQIRQAIFGKTAPDKLQRIQKTTMRMICDNILDAYPEFKITMVGSDELVVYEYGEYSIAEAYALVMALIPPFIDYLRCEAFMLKQIHPERSYFARIPFDFSIEKNFEDETTKVVFNGYKDPQFKAVPTLYFAQVYKNYYGMEITPDDLVFMHEGMVARFDKSIYG